MKIAIGCDHPAFSMKLAVIEHLKELGHELTDFGTATEASCDYPDYAVPVAESVASGENQFGILICGTGLGMSYAANKVKGIRAACVSESISARLAREHNNAQVICFGARIVGIETAFSIVDAFVNTPFSEGPRHQNRIDKIAAMESK